MKKYPDIKISNDDKKHFIHLFDKLADDCFWQAARKGFWCGVSKNNTLIYNLAKIAMIHTELSKASEALRNNNSKSEHIPQFSEVEEEIADTIIRICDLSHRNNWRIAEAIFAKLNFNETRPFKHGKKF